MSVTVTPMKTCKCGSFVVSSSEAEPHFGYSKLGVISKHGVEVCVFGVQAAEEMEQELAALRTATRLRRPTPEQMKLEPSGARALVGISRVPYEAFRSMLIDLSPTLSYLVDGVVLETGSAVGTQLRVKMRSVEIATYQCDACAGDKDVRFSGLFDAVAPEPYETNQDVACPYCHSPNDVRRA